VVGAVFNGSPAERAGLQPGDELASLDGVKLQGGKLRSLLRERRPGARARLGVFRDERLRGVGLRLARAQPGLDMVTAKRAPAGASSLYQAWLGAEREKLPAPAPVSDDDDVV